MKKSALLMLPVLLAACEKKPSAEIIIRPCCDAEEKLGDIKLKVWQDKFTAIVHNQEIPLELQKNEDGSLSKYGDVYHLEYIGMISDTDEKISIRMTYDSDKEYLGVDSVSVSSLDAGYSTDIIHNIELKQFPAQSATEKCIKEIHEKIGTKNSSLCAKQNVKRYRSRFAKHFGSYSVCEHIIAESDAVKISEQNNFLDLYKDDDKIESQESDACDVLARINTYRVEHDLDKEIVLYEDEIYCEKPYKVVPLNIMSFRGLFNGIVLNMCTDGRHSFSYDYDTNQRWDLLEQGTDDNGNIRYSGKVYDHKQYDILYNPNTDEYYVKEPGVPDYRLVEQGRLTEIQKCAREINFNVRQNSSGGLSVLLERNSRNEDGKFFFEDTWIDLPQEQALAISSSFNYDDLKLYSRGDEAHEIDACIVKERLREFIRAQL